MTLEQGFLPPDGGWGWVIMFAYVISNILIVPIQQNFGFLFSNTFNRAKMTGTMVTSVISVNISLSLLIGTCTGPLIKRFGIRTLAVCGAILFTIGVFSLTFASDYVTFVLSYGVLTGIGEGLIRLTSALSLNLYFHKRRRKVVGLAIALRSLGSIAFPQLVVRLLTTYGTTSTVLLIGAICFHSVCVSLLLRPVEWYAKKPSKEEEIAAMPLDVELNLLGQSEKQENNRIRKKRHSVFRKIIYYYDLALFKNPRFLSIMGGMMFSQFADMSFETLIPLVLLDLNFNHFDIATFLSTSYISNVIIRFIAPFIGDYLKQSSKCMYGVSCFIIVIGRFTIIYFARGGNVIIPILWGIAHGFRSMYWSVVIAENVPASQLPSAESINFVINGTCSLLGGPLLGWVRDITGTYVTSVYIINALTAFTCTLWFSEWVYHIIRTNKGCFFQNSTT